MIVSCITVALMSFSSSTHSLQQAKEANHPGATHPAYFLSWIKVTSMWIQ